jgi:hypothetical protein
MTRMNGDRKREEEQTAKAAIARECIKECWDEVHEKNR